MREILAIISINLLNDSFFHSKAAVVCPGLLGILMYKQLAEMVYHIMYFPPHGLSLATSYRGELNH